MNCGFVYCASESAIGQRLSHIKVELELECLFSNKYSGTRSVPFHFFSEDLQAVNETTPDLPTQKNTPPKIHRKKKIHSKDQGEYCRVSIDQNNQTDNQRITMSHRG